MFNLTRKQIQQLHELMEEYSDADGVQLTYSGGSGIGTNIYATVKYTACREYTLDITDYENW